MFWLIYFRLYLPFLLNVFYVLHFNLFTLSLNIYSVRFIYAICVERVHVGHIANLCITRLRMMHLTWTYEMCGYRIVNRILDSLRMTTVACYLVSVLYVFHSWFWQHNLVVLWHTNIRRLIKEQQGYAGDIMNRRYTRLTPDNTRGSLFLGGFRTDSS
jgi:hypothetical protein